MESIIGYFRTKAILHPILPFMQDPPAKVLDIGAGSCHIAQTLATRHHIDVAAVDVVDHNITNFPLQKYDGKRLPYANHSFDIGLIVFVLHHAPDPDKLLAEAGRACKRLIIVEDLPGNAVERALWKRLDYLFNHAQHKDIAVAHEAKTAQEWQAWFASRGYTLAKSQKFRSLFTTGRAYPHVVFVLKRK